MRTPQTEDGYTRIANELLEAFTTLDASGSAWRVFMVVLRKTYGFHKKEDKISLTQFGEMSRLSRMSVCRGLNELVEKNVLSVKKEGYINKYSVQKDYSGWGSIKPVTSNKNDTKSSIKPVTKTSNKNDTYKRKKDNKDISKTKVSQSMSIKGYNENQHFDDLPAIGDDGEVEKPKEKTKRHYKEVYEVFYRILNIQPLTRADWAMNTTEQKSADNLYTMKGLEQVERALILFRDNKDVQYCPKIHSPNSLVRKWKQLYEFKEENGL